MSAPLVEKGYINANTSPWWRAPDDAEDTPELRWPLNIEVFDAMRRQDSQVMSVLRAVTLPIRRTQWRIDPAGASDDVTNMVAEDLGLDVKGRPPRPGRTRDRFSWDEHLRMALTMLPFGHAFFEQVYRLDANRQVRLRKLAWRPPRTISKIDVAADGGLVAVEQYSNGTGKTTRIGVADLVAYVHEREGGNWLGQSLLRPAYKFWLLKDRALRTQSMTLDRNGLGIPVYKGAEPPAGLTGEDLKTWQQKELKAGLELAAAVRSGEDAGAAVPYKADLIMRGVEGHLPDSEKPIRYYDEQIARAVLAHFLNLGTETGSWALGSTFADFFTQSLQSVADAVADVTNQHVIEDLVDYNYGPDEPAPRLVFDEIGSKHPMTADAIRSLIDCGAITADQPLEDYLRDHLELPAADPATRRKGTGRNTNGDL